MANKRVAVTGGSGFIGSHLCERLLGMGHEVICVDNFFTGRKQNIIHLMGDPKFELVRHDVTQSILLEIDWIFHMACPASPVHYQFNPIKTIKTNVMGTMNMLGLAKRVGARFLQASTSEVYGDPLEHPQQESYWGNVNPLGERSCYDEGKRVAESLCYNYHREHGVEVRIARIFNTYGPRMQPDDGRVVSNFIMQALWGRPLTIYGDGSQTRSFCYVDDLVTGLIALMEKDDFMGPVNLGNPGEFTIRQLAEAVIAKHGKGEIIAKPLPADDPKRRKPNIALANEVLGWSPAVSLDAGLERAYDWFRVQHGPT